MGFYRQRRRVVAAGRRMARAALAVGTWGNISCRLDRDSLAITPSGLDYEALRPRDIVIVDLQGRCREGRLKPSTELPLHRAVYAAREDVHAIVHTHSVYASAFAAARRPIPAAMEDLVQIVGGEVRVADYALPGSAELGQRVVEALAGRSGVLLANHGALGAAASLDEALLICEIIEKSARIMVAAQAIGGVVALSQEDIDTMRAFFLHEYGQRKGGSGNGIGSV